MSCSNCLNRSYGPLAPGQPPRHCIRQAQAGRRRDPPPASPLRGASGVLAFWWAEAGLYLQALIPADSSPGRATQPALREPLGRLGQPAAPNCLPRPTPIARRPIARCRFGCAPCGAWRCSMPPAGPLTGQRQTQSRLPWRLLNFAYSIPWTCQAASPRAAAMFSVRRRLARGNRRTDSVATARLPAARHDSGLFGSPMQGPWPWRASSEKRGPSLLPRAAHPQYGPNASATLVSARQATSPLARRPGICWDKALSAGQERLGGRSGCFQD